MCLQCDVIDYLLRARLRQLPTDRRWTMISLFNGMDGFIIGLEKAAEANCVLNFAFLIAVLLLKLTEHCLQISSISWLVCVGMNARR